MRAAPNRDILLSEKGLGVQVPRMWTPAGAIFTVTGSGFFGHWPNATSKPLHALPIDLETFPATHLPESYGFFQAC